MNFLNRPCFSNTWSELIPGERNDQDSGGEFASSPNIWMDVNDDNIVNFLDVMSQDYLVDNKEEVEIPTVHLNNIPNIDPINTDAVDQSEAEFVDIENVSHSDGLNMTDSERLYHHVSKMDVVQNSNILVEVVAKKITYEEFYADMYIDSAVLEFWIAYLLEEYPQLYDLPI